jgi:gluconokinase
MAVLTRTAQEPPWHRLATWTDSRAKEEASELWKAPAGKFVYERTGTPIHPMTPLLKLMWVRTHQPKIFQEAAKFVSQKEGIWYQWFGEWCVEGLIHTLVIPTDCATS